jgi:hypothetical protein
LFICVDPIRLTISRTGPKCRDDLGLQIQQSIGRLAYLFGGGEFSTKPSGGDGKGHEQTLEGQHLKIENLKPEGIELCECASLI